MKFIKSLAGLLMLVALMIAPFALFPGCGALPPIITRLVADPAAIPVEGTTMISCEATSSSSANLTYTWSAEHGTLSSTSGNTVYWTAPSTKGSYTIVVIVSDGSQSVSNTVTVYVTDKTSPIVSTITANPTTVLTGGSSVISCEATSPYTSDLIYTWVAGGGSLSSTSGRIVTWTAPSVAGTYNITVVISDGSTSTSSTIQIVCSDPSDPIITRISSVKTTVAINKTTTLTCEATDPNGYALSYSWSASAGTLLSNLGTTVTWQAPATARTTIITCEVVNTKSATAAGTLNIVAVVPGQPVISSFTGPNTTTAGSPITVTCNATDPDDLEIFYRWTSSGGGYTSSSSNTAQWSALTAGNYTLTVEASNGGSLSATATKEVSVTVP